MLIGKLNVVCRQFVQRSTGPERAKRNLTAIQVRLGNEVVAERTIPGKWDEVRALAEFKRFPDKFTKTEKWASIDLKSLAA